MLAVVRDVLTYAEAAAGQVKLHEADLNLQSAVESVAELFSEKAASKGISIEAHVADDIPTLLKGDLGRWRQVLVELVNNAVKFTDQGHVAICLTKESETETNAEIRVAVTDTGIGVPESAQGSLFSPFSQGRGTAANEPRSTGFGLAISQKLAELLGGSIGFESSPGQGSTFWFTLHLEKTLVFDKAADRSTSFPGERLLLVTDCEMTRETVEQLLHGSDVQNNVIKSAAGALQLLRKASEAGQPYHAVVIDSQLSDVDGITLAEVVKTDGRTSGTKVILLHDRIRRGEDVRPECV